MTDIAPQAPVAPQAPMLPEGNQYSPEVAEVMQAKGWKGIEDVVTSYKNLEKYAGAPADRHLLVPADDKDEKGWESIYNKLGRPESPDKYDYKNESGIDLDAESIKQFQAIAHKNGVTNKQFKAIMDSYTGTLKTAEAKYKESKQQEFDTCDKALSEKWKDQKINNVQEAFKVSEKLGLTKILDKKGLGNDPELIEALYNIKAMMGESVVPQGQPAASQKSSEQELQEILKHPAFTSAVHPEHQNIMRRFYALHGVKSA